MKRHWKKAVVLILLVCLLFSAIPPHSVAAAGSVTTYDLNLVENGLVKSAATITSAQSIIENRYKTALWKWESSSFETESSVKFYEAGLTAMGNTSSWMAIRIQSPGTGLYTLGLDYAASPHNGTVAVYVLPGTVTDITATLKPENRVGKLNIWEENQSGVADYKTNYTARDDYVGTCQLTAGQEYIVVFEASEASPYYASRSYMCFSRLTLTQGDVFAEQELDAIVSSVVVHPGPVTLLEGCYYGTTVQVNGKDYMFEPVEGGKLLAFDMDSFVRKYEVDLPFLTPRGITADDSGSLWLCGDSKFLYRYDPVTHIAEQTRSFEDVDPGVTSGFDMVYADGCLYFGTYPAGSIIKYDIEADTFTRLYTNGGSYANGIVCKDGYLYAGIYDVRDKNNESWKVIRIDLVDTDNVTLVDVSDKMLAGQMFYDAGLAGDLLLFGGGQSQDQVIAVNINTMTVEELPITGGIQCSITEEVDGKVYFVLNNGPQGTGLYAFDVQSKTLSNRLINTTRGLRCADRSIIQVDDENYPGNNIAVYAPATGEPMLYNLEQNKTKRGLELIEDYGTATYVRSLTNGADGSGDIYIGAFNVDNCAAYNTGSNTLTKFATLGQTDSMCYYAGKLYAGNYPDGAIVRVDLEDPKNNEVILELNDDVYDQARIHTLTAGDGKIFAGTTPDKGLYGGCLAWVDLETGESRVVQNVVQDQTVNCIVYHDGLIYGTTSIYGGTSTTKRSDLSAKLFVYDVENDKKLAEFDLKEPLGLTANIEYISGIAPDPDVVENGRFWGLVSETLFSFTYDKAANKLTVTEELSYKKDSYETGGGRTWFPKPFCFDGKGNLYLSFETNGGTRRINVNDTSDNTRLTMPNVLYYALGEDGNLYYGISETLYAYPLEVSAADWEEPAALDQQIRAIGTPVTLEDAPAIREACAAYDKLDLAHKALVQYADVLESAEAELLDLQIQELAQTAAYTYKPQVLALYEQYGSLTDAQKRAVKNSPALFTAYDAVSDKCYAADGAFFMTFAQAMEKALLSDSKTVTLIDNATEDEVLLTGGVILDLGGHTLQAEAFRANLSGVAEGYVVDSGEDNMGLLMTQQGEDLFLSTNPDLPMYDAVAGGYRLFDYTLELHSSTETVDEGKQKFWFKFHFRNSDNAGAALDQDAYELVKAGGSDLEISARLTWKDTALPQVYFGIDGDTDAFSAAWATGATESRWFYLTVSGLDDITSGKLTVEPVLTAGNVEVTGGVITYEKKIGGTGDWSDEGPAM